MSEVKVTEDFLGLDMKTKNCQNETTVHGCEQEKWLLDTKKKCQCLPYHLKNYSLSSQVR